MSLKLKVVSYKGVPVKEETSVSFDKSGGTIGRAPDNHLVLQDPEKVISRRHGSISFDNGSYSFSDTSTVGSYVSNKDLLLRHASVLLDNGDHLKIGDYEILVMIEDSFQAPAAANEDLFKSFLEGAGIDETSMLAPDERSAAMKTVGVLFRDMVGGLMAVLRATHELKSPSHVSLPAMGPSNHNPLKFTDRVEDAIKIMLARAHPGCMGPIESVQEGFSDIRNHHFALNAGIQASLVAVLKRFDPEDISRPYQGLIVFHKKAKCWNAYKKAYPKLVGEGLDGFFGEAFLEGYERQISALRSSTITRAQDEQALETKDLSRRTRIDLPDVSPFRESILSPDVQRSPQAPLPDFDVPELLGELDVTSVPSKTSQIEETFEIPDDLFSETKPLPEPAMHPPPVAPGQQMPPVMPDQPEPEIPRAKEETPKPRSIELPSSSTADSSDPFGNFGDDDKTVMRPRPVGRKTVVARTDEVHLAVSTPRFVKPGTGFIARFAAYIKELEEDVRRKIEIADRGRSEFIPQPETCRWRQGAPITVRVIGDCFTAQPSQQSFDWDGREAIKSFQVRVDAQAILGPIQLGFEISVAGFPEAWLWVNLEITTESKADERSEAVGLPARSAFASYASEDLPDVLARISTLISYDRGLDVFHSWLDLVEGEDWQLRLEKEVIRREVLFLFWSSHAKSSEWVDWEWRTALRVKGLRGIQPMPIEPPEIAAPPEELAPYLNFRDRYLVAREAARRIADRKAEEKGL